MKKSKLKAKHSVAKEFPSQGNPQQPTSSLPNPIGGQFEGQQLPGAPMLPGQPM